MNSKTSTLGSTMPQSHDTYDSRSILLHWLTAVLVVGLWIAGQIIDFFPRGTPRVTMRSLHITFGLLLGIVLIVRVAWRRSGGAKLAPADPGTLGRVAVGVHHLLYALVAVTVVIGITSVWVRGDTLFNLFTVPAFDPSDKQLRRTVVEFHELAANTLLIVAGLHAAAALWHHYVRKDRVMRRMWPSA